MATRRRIGVSAATTEAARRQLMQPVQCWEKVWSTPENAPAGSTLKVYRWVKTEKTQQFSDDEGAADEPLAPLPDEPDVDEDLDQEDAADVPPEPVEAPELTATQDELSKPPSPKPQLSMSLGSAADLNDTANVLDLDASLNPLGGGLDIGMDLEKDQTTGAMDFAIPGLGAGDDGLSLGGQGGLGAQ